MGVAELYKSEQATLHAEHFKHAEHSEHSKHAEHAAALVLYTLRMVAGENRFSTAMNGALNAALDALHADLAAQAPTARVALLVTGTGKYFSVGLDLASFYESATPQKFFQETYQRFLGRLLGLGVVTVAAVNGHAIAGGMVAALACDYRVMNAARGFMAMNEIQLPSSIPAGMMAVVQDKVRDAALQRDIFLLGRRWTSREMHARGVVDVLKEDEDAVYAEAVRLAREHAHTVKKMPFVALIKRIQYRDSLKMLTELEPIDHFLHSATINKL